MTALPDEGELTPRGVGSPVASEPAAAASSSSGPSVLIGTRQRRVSGGWLAIVILLLVQWGLFRQHAAREIVWAYPTSYDQSTYLNLSYESYERILTHGWLTGLWDSARTPIPNGVLIHLQAAVLFLLIGPSRLSALTLNFAHFALLQCAFVGSVRSVTSRWATALLGEGLLLAAAAPFFWAGGLMDFRLDFIAFCLFGILVSLVVRSRLFLSSGWSAAAGVVAALMVLLRFITLVYPPASWGRCSSTSPRPLASTTGCHCPRRCPPAAPQSRAVGGDPRGAHPSRDLVQPGRAPQHYRSACHRFELSCALYRGEPRLLSYYPRSVIRDTSAARS
jgi:hypothetical protein